MAKDRKSAPEPAPGKRKKELSSLERALPAAAPFAFEPGEPRWSALVSRTMPLEVAAVNTGYLEMGLAAVVIARRWNASVLCAHFVVDLLACGVLDCYGEALARADLDRYLIDLDDAVPLESCTDHRAATIVHEGIRCGEAHGIAQPEHLELWQRLLPEPEPGYRLFGAAGRPMLVADLITGFCRPEGAAWLEDVPAACYVDPGRGEH